MKKTLLLLVLCWLSLTTLVKAQQKNISGTVLLASDKTPLVGVSVSIIGKSVHTQTDANGKFSIVSATGDRLRFTYVGFITQDIAPSTQSNLTVLLQENTAQLGEVVVTAMGIKREKRALGYSVQEIKSDELLKNKDPNIINSLNGKIAGVNVTNSGGAPGSSASIIIRGGTSLERDNQPLFVIDGMPMDNSTGQGDNSAFDGTTNIATTNSNRAMDLNPEDIESMSVLKGPAAAALYGLRAAAGAIIITTKKGKDGVTSISFNSRFVTNWVNRLPEQQSIYKQGTYYTGAYSDQTVRSWGNKFTEGETIYDNLGDFFKTAQAYDNSLNISGGNATGNYFMSASNLNQGGVVPTTDFKRTTVRFNAEQRKGIFTFGINSSYAKSSTQKTLTGGGLWSGGGNGFMEGVAAWPRNNDMKNWISPTGAKVRLFPNMNLWDVGDFENPYWVINKNPQRDKTNRFIGNVYTTAKIAEWFDVTYRLGIDNYKTSFSNLISPGSSVKEAWAKGMYSERDLDYNYVNSNLMLNFHKTVAKDWELSLLTGFTNEDTRTKSTSARAENFDFADMVSVNNASEANKYMVKQTTRKRLVGLYGDFRVAYKNFIYLSVTGRNDWTSTLTDGNNSFFYPSYSGSFVFSELIPKNDVLSFGKIRASFAKVGKDAPAYQTATYLFGPEQTIGGGYRNSWTRGNPLLTPEFTKSTEFGTELRFLKDRIGIDVTYYNTKSTNQILQPRVSNATGYILSYVNTGDITNKGVELSINASPIKTSDFKWETTLNFSHNKGIVTSLPGSLPILYVTDVQVGNAKAASFNKGTFGGVYSEGTFMALSGSKWQTDPQGNLLLDWVTGRPLTSTSTTTYVGNREPDFIGGWNNNFNYKNWSLNFLVDFRKGGDIYNGTEYLLTDYGLSKRTENRGQTISFTGMSLNPISKVYEKVTRDVVADEKYFRDVALNNAPDFIENVNWLRLRSISLSYSLPDNFLNRVKFIKGATITATGTNLLLITNYSGMDPETSAAGAGVIGSGSVGIDYAGVPATSGFALGLNVKF
ncbi:SusC/RagA family TonB-linked outer membrane protein [Pedobacter hiemivivus]|uniref:SusC/RagA family TonB-linked outer membrane protein n=1 Tax=Pedobacter hiemivivus TaxID=2530454 RepID=A0A4U1GMZ7_9SPHI|nr:SusC/RagA family TonB-linked outer membrane protein [Pedobacter hiemivivus]TKC65394.1 SusC/RagA family TonB-linked outer membrane protein [Pedobacter hiemivivus]